MSLAVVTVQPNNTVNAGTAVVVPGADTPSQVLSDGSSSTYIEIFGLCRLLQQLCRVSFPIPTLPTGAQIYSVGLRRNVMTVPSGGVVPVCNHFFRIATGTIQVSGQKTTPAYNYFTSTIPVTQTTPAFTQESVGTYYTAPGGAAWTLANLATFTYDIGRGDSDTTTALSVSEVFLDITYQQLSTVTITAPTGTVQSTRPTITWTYTSPDSQPQESFNVGVYTAAQVALPGFNPLVTPPLMGSGWTLGEVQQWICTQDLTDGVYYVYVQCTSRWDGPGTFYTPIVSQSFTRQVFSSATPAATGGPPLPAVFTSASFDSVNNRVPLTWQPGTQPTISAAGTVNSGGVGTTTLSVSPTVGCVLVLATSISGTTNDVVSVSGGGVSTWIRVAGPQVGTSSVVDMWMGVVTSSGTSTITITGQSSLSASTNRLLVQQFASSVGAATQWAFAVAAAGQNNASSTNVPFPTITPSGTNQVYVGYASTATAGLTTGQTSGYTVDLDNGNNPFIYGLNVSTIQSPVAVQTSAGVSTAVGALLTAAAPTTAFTVFAQRDGETTFTAIPSLTLLPANGMNPLTYYDEVANLNEPSLYQVIAYSGSPFEAASAPSTTLTVNTAGIYQHWFKNPKDPLMNTAVTVSAPKDANDGIKITERQMKAYYPMLSGSGQKVPPFTVSGPVYGDEYQIEMLFETPTELNVYYPAVKQLLQSGETLLFQRPDGIQLWVDMGPGPSGQNIEETYDVFPGDITRIRWRRIKAVLTETSTPSFY